MLPLHLPAQVRCRICRQHHIQQDWSTGRHLYHKSEDAPGRFVYHLRHSGFIPSPVSAVHIHHLRLHNPGITEFDFLVTQFQEFPATTGILGSILPHNQLHAFKQTGHIGHIHRLAEQHPHAVLAIPILPIHPAAQFRLRCSHTAYRICS